MVHGTFLSEAGKRGKFIDSRTLRDKADEKVVEINMMKGRECVQNVPKGGNERNLWVSFKKGNDK